jgi:membrane-associated PAP2 superfamily phosphatase
VALGRIMSGAHYLSDVYIGGTITFLWYCLIFNIFKSQKINNYLNISMNEKQNFWKIMIFISMLLISLFIGLQFQIC